MSAGPEAGPSTRFSVSGPASESKKDISIDTDSNATTHVYDIFVRK